MSAGPLAPLIGEWEVEVPQFPGQTGHTTFEWLDDGTHLRFRAVAPEPAPTATLIIGRDELAKEYAISISTRGGLPCVLHDVQRRCVAHVARRARLLAAFLGNGQRRRRVDPGTREKSEDGSVWERDFELIYTRTG